MRAVHGLVRNGWLGAVLEKHRAGTAPRKLLTMSLHSVRPQQAPGNGLVLLLIPIGFAVLGLAIRYLAYRQTVGEAWPADFIIGMCRWDCGWYVRLSQEGYDPFPVPSMINAGNWAFFPALPMLVGALRLVTGLPTMLLATATSLVLSIASARLAWPTC